MPGEFEFQGWFQPLAEPRRSLPRRGPVYLYYFWLDEQAYTQPEHDRWFQPFSQPLPLPRLATGQIPYFWTDPLSLTQKEAVTVDRWFVPFSEPLPPPRLSPAHLPFTWDIPVPEAPGFDKWYMPLQEPVIIVPRLIAALNPDLFYHPFTPTPKLDYDWFLPLSSPAHFLVLPPLPVGVYSNVFSTVELAPPPAPTPDDARVFITMRDSSGQDWRINVQEAGTLVPVLVGGTPRITAPRMIDSDGGNVYTTWDIVVSILGVLSATQVTDAVGECQNIPLVSKKGLYYLMRVDRQGSIFTQRSLTEVATGGVDLGELISNPLYPEAVQPGGPGTEVTDPTQEVNERTGRFYPGCSHSINNWEIVFQIQDGCEVAIVRCPMCGYVQRIISPASKLYDEENWIIIA